ncbi:MAG: flagellar motor switch protein FliG [Methylosarcina sp.]
MKNAQQFNQKNSRLPASRLIISACALTASMALIIVPILWFQSNSFLSSIRSASNENAVSVLEVLDAEGIPSNVKFDTGTETVPIAGTDERTLRISQPNNSLMISTKDKEFETGKNVELMRFHKLLEAEIARSLMLIHNIRSAKVLLALAEHSENRTKDNESSASVMVTIDQPRTLQPYQIKAIVNLVAASVPKLKAERVILVDQRGRLLNSSNALVPPDLNAGQFEYKQNLEDQLKERIINILTPLAGAEALRVEVTADVNFTGNDQSQDNSHADFAGAISKQSPKPEGTVAQSGLILAESNTEPDHAAKKDHPANSTEKAEKSGNPTRPYLRRLSVAVVVDDALINPADKQVKVRPFNRKDLDGFSKLVKQAVGFDSSRGDQLTLTQASFQKPVQEQSKKDLPYWQQFWFYRLMNQLIVGLAILLWFFGIVRPLIRHWTGWNGDGLANMKYSTAREAARAAYGADRSGFPSAQMDEFRQALRALPNDVIAILQFDTPQDYLHRLEYIKKIADADARLVAETLILNLKKTEHEPDQSEKAALLMLSLGKDRAADVIRRLSPREMQKLGIAMANVKDASTSALDKAAEEFIAKLKSQNALIIDKDDYIHQVFSLALGEDKAKRMMDRVLPGTLTKGIEQFKWMDGRSVADLISNEHPQIIAIILSVLDSEQAAEVIMSVPETLRSDLLVRIAMMKGVQPSALRELDQMIEHRLPDNDSRNSTPIGGIEAAAGILNRIDSRAGDIILGEIADQNAELARTIQEKMLIFDDLIHLDVKDMQTLLREISTSQLLLALTEAGEGLKEKIFKSMSRRAAEMLREDMAAAPAASPGEIEFARKAIVRTVKKLADAGELRLCINKELS